MAQAPDLSVQALFNVRGKTALVTGGGTGIGKTIASALVQNGAKVYIAARNESQLKETTAELNARGPGTVQYIVANLSNKAGVDALISALSALESSHKLHILVNNSGATWGAPLDNVPEQKGWDNVMAVNLKSVFYLTVGLLPWLASDSTALDPGRVINISSVAGYSPHAEGLMSAKGNGTFSYNVSKAALNHLTSVLAVKLAPQLITVNAICPGMFPTKMTAFAYKNVGEDALTARQPTGRFGMPSDIAGVALFLSSPASAHVTGGHIIVDGGCTLSSQGIAPQSRL
ncbi:hypothetical protein SCLCIDRAFT_1213899 [Scleroderma citrinum Foug A]|uniref:Rhamnolipids biosynthesis 3-oxoacyl-[acyl-carrier-protein] reductase n=1 Tax=Scleroderma citrinum Foug A TaxID=1036808 RepID=A0A0C3E6V3_9AGAM|nr:hypothetical protein SCLCIDRAFT_1213899 [Scleroderma citrinum Foug A]